MKTDDDLRAWGELPATIADEILIEHVDRSSPRIDSRPAAISPAAAPISHDILERREQQGRILRLLIQCADTIRDHCHLSRIDVPPTPFPEEFEFIRLLGQGSFGQVWLTWRGELASAKRDQKTVQQPSCHPDFNLKRLVVPVCGEPFFFIRQ